MTKKNSSILDLQAVSAALAALSVKELFPDAILGQSGPTSLGFFCDFFLNIDANASVLSRIEERMEQSLRENGEVNVREMTPFSAKEYFTFHKEPLLAQAVQSSLLTTVFLIEVGGRLFLSDRFPGVKRLGEIGAVKVYKSEVLGGSRKRIRIHGAAFFDKAEKKQFAKECADLIGPDHVRLGEEKNLFRESGEDWVWFPRGEKIKSLLFQRMRDLSEECGFVEVSTCPVTDSSDPKKYFKAHLEIFQKLGALSDKLCISENVTVCESVDKVFDAGLLDCSVFQANISHIFCRRELLSEKLISYLHFVSKIFKILDFAFQIVVIGKEKTPENAALIKVLQDSDVPFSKESGEALKVEWRVKDRMGLYFPFSSMKAPRRVEKGEYVCVPVSIFVSLERAVALLLENRRTGIPAWLADPSIRVFPAYEKNVGYANEVVKQLKKRGVRALVGDSKGELKTRIRSAFSEEVPFVIAVGDREAENKTVTLRKVGGADSVSLSIEELLEMVISNLNRSDCSEL